MIFWNIPDILLSKQGFFLYGKKQEIMNGKNKRKDQGTIVERKKEKERSYI